MDDIILYSGWICTIISTIIAIKQFSLKEKYKKVVNENNNFKAKTGDNSTIYQGKDFKVDN